MKIIYSAGNLIGANLRLSEFLKHCNHEVKIAAYYKNHYCLDYIHWCLDALYLKNAPKNEDLGFHIPHTDNKKLSIIIDYIVDWNPDLIIVDYEPILATVSKVLNIPLLSCSPMHLLDGLDWNGIKNKTIFTKAKQNLKYFDHAFSKFIYSPFYLLNNCMQISNEYQFIKPYNKFVKIKNNFNLNAHISNGETNCVFNGLLNKDRLFIYNPNDDESKLNGFLINNFGCGINVGRINNNQNYLHREIERFNNMKINYSTNNLNCKYLHEVIECF